MSGLVKADQHLIEARLDIDPEPLELRWLQDVFGNSVALATFKGRSKFLHIESMVRMEHKPMLTGEVEVQPYARLFPFSYAPEEMGDLSRSIERQHHDPDRVLDKWARRFLKKDTETETVAMLTDMTKFIRRISLICRAPKGYPTPVETIPAQGTCRDFAVLIWKRHAR